MNFIALEVNWKCLHVHHVRQNIATGKENGKIVVSFSSNSFVQFGIMSMGLYSSVFGIWYIGRYPFLRLLLFHGVHFFLPISNSIPYADPHAVAMFSALVRVRRSFLNFKFHFNSNYKILETAGFIFHIRSN